jgi:hypothetical protein
MIAKLLLISFIIPLFVTAQETCKVLLPALDSIYVGECKKGMANGSGEAWGKFYYKGKFSSGYPDGVGRAEYPDGSVYNGLWKNGLRNGKGTLTFKENGRDVEKTWIWKNDVKQNEVIPPSYRIITQRNIGRFRVYDQGGVINSVWFYPNSDGGVISGLQDFFLSGSSGKEISNNSKIGYEDVTFPFKGSVKYKAWNKLRTTEYELYLEIEITKPGNWVVEIQN